MSHPRAYPPATFHRGTGETSAWLRPTDAEPDVVYPDGGTCAYIATGDQTKGRFGLYRWTFGETESGPEPHFHRTITECFYILGGTVRVYDGREWVTARSGDYLHVPEGGVHGFKGSGGASMLLMFAPGAPREEYFETIATGAAMTAEERAEFMLRHDNYWV